LPSCGDGTLTVARETSPGKFEIIQTVQTPRGARTMGSIRRRTRLSSTAELGLRRRGQTGPPKPGTFMISRRKPFGQIIAVVAPS